MARVLQINYGALTVGLTPSDASLYLTDAYISEETNEDFRIAFKVVATAASSATLITAEQHLAGELSTRDQSLTVVMGSTRHTYVPASNTGFLTRGRARKTGQSDTQYSSEWDCEVTAVLPETTAGRNGRRTGRVRYERDASEREIGIFTGTYTALTSNSASDQYDAEVDTWVNAQLTAAGGSWNPLGRQWEYDDEDKLLTFVDRRERILLEEGQGLTNHASVAGQQLRVIRRSFGDRRARVLPDTEPFRFIAIAYSASIRSSQTAPSGLKALWEGELRAHVLAQADAEVIIQREMVDYDKANNRITALIEGRERQDGLIESRVTITGSFDPGVVLLPRWDGNIYSRARDQGLASNTVEVLVRTLTTFGADPRVGRAIPDYLTPSDWEQVFYQNVSDDFTQGLVDGSLQDYTARTDLFVYVRRDLTEIGGGGGRPETGLDVDPGGPSEPDGGFTETGDGTVVRVDEALGL